MVDTGQHYDDNMAGVFFKELGLPKPDYSLQIGSGSHGAQTGRMLEAIELVLIKEQPGWVVVFGDTNSTLAGALAAAKLHFPLAHIEAGLRSYNRRMPEEINRVLADQVSNLLFAPTESAKENLVHEGVDPQTIEIVGDVMVDAVYENAQVAEATSKVLAELELQRKGYVLSTIHRAENTDDPGRLGVILGALAETAGTIPVVLPLHPRTKAAIDREGMGCLLQNLAIIPPAPYLDMLMLEKHAALIATDSGGVQKEAYLFSVPCVTLRTETEWTELVEAGWNRLAPPTDVKGVALAIREELSKAPRQEAWGIYGDGHAATRIAARLVAGVPAGAGG